MPGKQRAPCFTWHAVCLPGWKELDRLSQRSSAESQGTCTSQMLCASEFWQATPACKHRTPGLLMQLPEASAITVIQQNAPGLGLAVACRSLMFREFSARSGLVGILQHLYSLHQSYPAQRGQIRPNLQSFRLLCLLGAKGPYRCFKAFPNRW